MATATRYGLRARSTDPRAIPAYTKAEASRYLRIPHRTLHDWVSGNNEPGGGRPRPLVSIADPSQHLLSFENMLELHVLAALRHVHRVRMRVIRNALDYLQTKLIVARPLIDEQMHTDGKTILVHRLDQLIDAGHDGQTSLLELLNVHLDRIERNPSGIATRLFLFTRKSRFLDHADRHIRRYIRTKEKLIGLLEEQKRAIIHEAVTGQIDVRTGRPHPAYRDSGVEWLGRVPEHWERRRLKTLLRAVDHRSVDGSETLLSLRRDHGIVIYAKHFSRPSQGYSSVGFKLVVPGQLVVNRLQANNGLIFCSALSGLVSPDYSVFERTTAVLTRYLSELLRTTPYRAHFRRQSTRRKSVRWRMSLIRAALTRP